MRRIDRATARQDILATLAADAACEPGAFHGDGVTVVEWREMPGRRRFEEPGKPFVIISMGHGVVVACRCEWLEWTHARASELDRDRFLGAANLGAMAEHLSGTGYMLYGPLPSYGCSVDTLRDFAPPPGIALDVSDGPMLDGLRSLGAFPNALAAHPNRLRPDMIAVSGRSDDRIVACAAASADSDRLWQVGVDVLPTWRGRGVGRAVVGRLTEAVLAEGKVPYYCHVISNIPSAALATSLGYWPAWVQWHAREFH